MRCAAVLASACTVLALTGCGGSAASSQAHRPAPSAPAAEALAPPRERCGSPDLPAKVVRMRTSDGVVLDGAEVGSGPAGAVFLHESPSDLCDWWPYAAQLERAHVRALMIDLRCFGRSGCPAQASRSQEPALDVAAAAVELRREGARTVTVVGASYGGASALVAASRLGRDVDGVVSLSGEPHLSDALDVPRVIGRLRAPLLLAVAPGDRYVTVAATRAMLRRSGSRRKRLLVRRSSGLHGVLLLGTDGSATTPLFGVVMRFVRAPR